MSGAARLALVGAPAGRALGRVAVFARHADAEAWNRVGAIEPTPWVTSGAQFGAALAAANVRPPNDGNFRDVVEGDDTSAADHRDSWCHADRRQRHDSDCECDWRSDDADSESSAATQQLALVLLATLFAR